MKTRTKALTLIHKTNMGILPLMLGSLTAALPLLAAEATATEKFGQAHAGHQNAAPAKLVELVRGATRDFVDVNAATAAGYAAFLGCLSGPDVGAMGIYYVNGALVGDGEIDGSRPAALIYEPTREGPRLVDVEFIVDAAT